MNDQHDIIEEQADLPQQSVPPPPPPLRTVSIKRDNGGCIGFMGGFLAGLGCSIAGFLFMFVGPGGWGITIGIGVLQLFFVISYFIKGGSAIAVGILAQLAVILLAYGGCVMSVNSLFHHG